MWHLIGKGRLQDLEALLVTSYVVLFYLCEHFTSTINDAQHEENTFKVKYLKSS